MNLEELIKSIYLQYDEKKASAAIVQLLNKIHQNGTYNDIYEYAKNMGSGLGSILKNALSAQDYVENRDEIIAETSRFMDLFSQYSNDVGDVCEAVQKSINEAAGINLKPQRADFDRQKAQGIVDKIVDGQIETIEENIKDFGVSEVDNTLKKNADLHNKAGFKAKIVREYDGVGEHTQASAKGGHPWKRACRFCTDKIRCGTFDYEDVKETGHPVWQRHENCGCTIEYICDGKREQVKNYKKTVRNTIKEDKSRKEDVQKYLSVNTKKPIYINRQTTKEAEEYADKYVSSLKGKYSGKVDYSGIELVFANDMNRAFTEVLESYSVEDKLNNIIPYNTREKRFKDYKSEASYEVGIRNLYYNKGYYRTQKDFNDHMKQYQSLINEVMQNIDSLIEENTIKNDKEMVKYLQALKDTGRSNVSPPDAYGSTIHELGHYLEDNLFFGLFKEKTFDVSSSYEKYAGRISAYATKTHREYIAESFAAYWKGERNILDPELVKIFDGARK